MNGKIFKIVGTSWVVLGCSIAFFGLAFILLVALIVIGFSHFF